MTTSNDTPLSPCPFCGLGKTKISENWERPLDDDKGKLLSVEISHWCGDVLPSDGHHTVIQIFGRSRPEAFQAWNSRAKLEAAQD